MDQPLKLKKDIINAIIERKSAQLDALCAEQQQRLQSANTDDEEHDAYESQKAQQMDEIEQHAEPLDALAEEIQRLRTIDLHEVHQKVGFGALVKTEQTYFLIGAAQDAFSYQNEQVIGLSAQAPLFEAMEGLRASDSCRFGETTYQLPEVM